MLPTFVIGLREGLEASLIVGIVLAFLKRNGRQDLMRWALLGVGLAIALCAGLGIALDVLSHDLPQRQQEQLETVVGVIAVAMVTYMVVWMKRHSRDLKKQLEGVAGAALANGSAWALVGMAFLAVLREGFETAVFLVAAFNGANNRGAAGGGAVLGIALAVALGYGIYRGGVRINLSKFFRVTGFVLVLVAAGLVQTAFRTAHEAGWVNWGQQSTLDLSSVVDPGSVQSALITGMLGIQPQPTLIELVAWLLYLVPLGLYVAWPQGKGLGARAVAGLIAVGAVVTGLVALGFLSTAPSQPSTAAAPSITANVVTSGGQTTSSPIAVSLEFGTDVVGNVVDPVTGRGAAADPVRVTGSRPATVEGIASTVYTASYPATTTTGPVTFDQLAALNGGRLPLGVRGAGGSATGSVQATTTEQIVVELTVTNASNRLIAATWSATVTVVAQGATGEVTVTPAEPATATLDADGTSRALGPARDAEAALAARADDRAVAGLLGVVAGLLAVVALGVLVAGFRRRGSAPPSAPSGPAAADPAGAPSASTEGDRSERPATTLSA